ncbi:hypothetical protein [Alcanivorax sp.]|jgi:uncharacterized membrane protein|uniref:hypothetical protein n=1 Tax=Alcanivorax sp. TaxID=1872427 RepID=UPI0032D98BAC
MKLHSPLSPLIRVQRFANVNKRTLAFNEILYSVILGFLPSIWFYYSQGKKGFLSHLENLMPSNPYVYYFFGLLGVQIFIMIVNYFFARLNAEWKDTLHRFHAFWMQIGFSILGIVRAIVGAILATMYFTVQEGEPGSVDRVLIAGAYVFILFLFSCMVMSSIQRISEQLLRTGSSKH